MTELVKKLPENYNDYYEPFIGAGALFFDLAPNNAYINDYNLSLVNLYTCIKTNPTEIAEQLEFIQNEFNSIDDKKSYYYQKREQYNSIINSGSIYETVLFIFLNRTNYNGLYRVNSNGKYNVPYGKRKKVELFSNRIFEMSELLQNTTITNLDFEDAVANAQEGDFVYFDPPYFNTFVDYKKDGFSIEDQERLLHLYESLTNRGVHCMLSNSNHEYITDLYSEYNISIVPVKRLINRNANQRDSTEIIVTNYEVQND